MLKKTVTLTTIAVGATLALSGAAHAEPNGDPAKYFDVTADFLPANTPEAIDAAKNGKNLIMSPYGITRTIACRGTNAADVYDCMQEDDLGWITLRKTDTPVGPTWLYLP
ncbi:hypothetical protein [Nocardia australiensis]|uniref:hypothetical protein n=1 Tax=Nocardia australiensis TaxID=2887191 RepID=UPI001D14514A|nr:hypothetical protein [Nocardia australiensis]